MCDPIVHLRTNNGSEIIASLSAGSLESCQKCTVFCSQQHQPDSGLNETRSFYPDLYFSKHVDNQVRYGLGNQARERPQLGRTLRTQKRAPSSRPVHSTSFPKRVAWSCIYRNAAESFRRLPRFSFLFRLKCWQEDRTTLVWSTKGL